MATSEEQFGKYKLVSRIAAGGMAEIFRARLATAKGITKQVVIKRILPHYAENPHFIQMFTNEAKIAMGLSHGNIAQVFDFGDIDGDWFLAMEFVDGQALSKVVKRARENSIPYFPTPLAVMVIIETLKALHYAHTRLDEKSRPLNIVHRDVSPQNVLVSYEGQVKLVDFGIAKAKYGQQDTQSGNIKGKYIYFSPEQARGKQLDGRTDVFAAGIMLYELLSGQLPFQGKLIEVLGKIVRGEFVPPSELNPEIPPAVERILLKAMALDINERYQTAGEFEHALSSWLHNSAPGFSSDTLAQFMTMLFETELVEDGKSVKLTPAFLEQVNFWKHDDIVPDQQDESSAKTTSERLPQNIRERDGRAKKGRLRSPTSKALLFGLPVVAAIGAFAGVVLFFRTSTFDLRVTSTPPGAAVRIDGANAPGETPLTIADLPSNQPHLVQVDAVGMTPWELQVAGRPRSITEVHAELEPMLRKVVEPEPVAQVDAGVAVPEPPVNDPDLLAPVVTRYPQATFSLLPRRHAKLMEGSKAARIDLDPNQTYRISAEGKLSFGGMLSDIFIEECVYVLTGPKVQSHEQFGILGQKPITITGVTRLYAFVTDQSPHDNSGALRVRIVPRSGEPLLLLVDAKQHDVMPEAAEMMMVVGLSNVSKYEITLRDGKVPARTRAKGKPGRVLFEQTTGYNIVEGAPSDKTAHRVFETGRKYEVKGSSAFWMWFPDDDLSDNKGSIEVEIVPIAGNSKTWQEVGNALQKGTRSPKK